MTVMTETKPKRPTAKYTMTVKGAISFLQEAKLSLQAANSDGRFIYRVVNQDGGVVSISSRLHRAVSIAVAKIYA